MDYERYPLNKDRYPECITLEKCPDAMRYKKGPIIVIVSVDEIDFFNIGTPINMKHLSISHPKRYPTWEEIKDARYRFMSRSEWVYQALPPPEEYTNIHRNCFHLWMIDEPIKIVRSR